MVQAGIRCDCEVSNGPPFCSGGLVPETGWVTLVVRIVTAYGFLPSILGVLKVLQTCSAFEGVVSENLWVLLDGSFPLAAA